MLGTCRGGSLSVENSRRSFAASPSVGVNPGSAHPWRARQTRVLLSVPPCAQRAGRDPCSGTPTLGGDQKGRESARARGPASPFLLLRCFSPRARASHGRKASKASKDRPWPANFALSPLLHTVKDSRRDSRPPCSLRPHPQTREHCNAGAHFPGEAGCQGL